MAVGKMKLFGALNFYKTFTDGFQIKEKKKDLIKQARSNRNAERSTMRKQMFFKVRKKNRYKTRMKYKEG
jgi:hypothetical protein